MKRKKKNHKVGTNKSGTVLVLPDVCGSESLAVEFMEAKRWGTTPCCPRCGDTDVYKMRDEITGERNARWLWRCRGCKRQYTVKVGTIMEDSPIPLRHWCYAFWAACASKKGVSALQIQRMTGLSYKSALFMMHRIRWAMMPTGGTDGRPLEGTVEVDETYIGGKRKGSGVRGRPLPSDKAGVLGMVERGGRVRLRHLSNFKAPQLRAAMREHIAKSSRLMTDEFIIYTKIGREFAGGHEVVTHSKGEYSRNFGDVTTNTMESVFALLKRSITGTFHSVSQKHLHRYLSEVEFRYNLRKLDDGARTVAAIQSAIGKRFTYQQQLAG